MKFILEPFFLSNIFLWNEGIGIFKKTVLKSLNVNVLNIVRRGFVIFIFIPQTSTSPNVYMFVVVACKWLITQTRKLSATILSAYTNHV